MRRRRARGGGWPSPLTRRRLRTFRRNRRGFWSLWIFLALFGLSLGAELIANDRPVVVVYEGRVYLPILRRYPETTFGGDFPTATVYRDPRVMELIQRARMDAVAAHPLPLRHRGRQTWAPRRRRPRRAPTGSAPTTRAATSRPG